jgi:hypothetical protein
LIEQKEKALAQVVASTATQARYAPPTASLGQGLVLHITADDKVQQRTSYPWWDKAKKNPFQQKFTPGQPGGKFSVILEGDTVPPAISGKIGQAYLFKGDNQLNVADTAVGDFERYQPFSANTWVRIDKKDQQFGLVTKLCEDNDGKAGWELSVHHDSLLVRITNVWPYNTLCVSSKTTIPVGEWAHVGFTYDGSSRAAGIRMFINGQEAPGRVHFDRLYRSIKALNRVRGNNGIRVGRRFYHGGLVGALDDVRVYARQLSALEMAQLAQQPATPAAQAEHAKMQSPAYQQALAELTAARRQECDLRHPWIETLVMAERDTVRPSYILDRGAYDAHKERVTPGTPQKVLDFEGKNLPANRLGLAKWLFSDQNPLVGRVIVNRYWQMLFGKGIVGTVEDFGNQGTLPTHPELLDWLAVEYRQTGWDTKKILKTMVLSATYRQASRTPATLRERDPDNSLLARGPSHRLAAEMLRDNALFTSGLLVDKVGGPSVFPYQPDGIWEATTSGRGLVTYRPDQGEGLYRRSLYTYWKRTVPPPAMLTLDAAARTLCAVKRQATSTPLQGLVLLNDPQMVEASRVLAEKLLAQGAVVVGGSTAVVGVPTNHTDPIGEAFFRLVSRRIQPSERQVLYDLYTEELANFGRNPQAAAKLLATGDAPRNPKLNPAQHAALTLVVSTIYNLDEAVTKR